MKPVFTIFTGDAKTLKLKAVYAESGDPLDLTSCTEIDIALPNANGSFTRLLFSTGDVVIETPIVLGKFEAAISAEDSALLQPGLLQGFDVTFTIGAEIMTIRFVESLSVIER